jgi:multisubunit Na+/H+ antiporter MnhE subunit
VLTLMAHVIALTPGTMTVEATSDPPVLYVHFLLLDDLAEARRSLARLERLAVAALGRPAVRGAS